LEESKQPFRDAVVLAVQDTPNKKTIDWTKLLAPILQQYGIDSDPVHDGNKHISVPKKSSKKVGSPWWRSFEDWFSWHQSEGN